MNDSARYPVPARAHRVEEEIQRSRFITSVGPASSTGEAKAFIEKVSAEFADATHNCWAFLVGSPGSSGRVGMSDDGEPHGTAGRPMLQVLSHCGVGDLAVVVTRYYGGKKLGKGGLVRAYSGGVKLALESLPLTDRVAMDALRVGLPYNLVDIFRHLAPQFDAVITAETYSDQVWYDIDVPLDRKDAFRDTLLQVGAGKIEIVSARV